MAVESIIQIKDKINYFLEKHELVNTIKYGDTDNLSVFKDIEYPLINVEYVTARYNASNNNSATFAFAVMDLSDEDIEFEVISRMNEIAVDILKVMEDPLQELEEERQVEINSDITLNPFSDQFADRVSGVTFNITFNTFRNNCVNILPFK